MNLWKMIDYNFIMYSLYCVNIVTLVSSLSRSMKKSEKREFIDIHMTRNARTQLLIKKNVSLNNYTSSLYPTYVESENSFATTANFKVSFSRSYGKDSSKDIFTKPDCKNGYNTTSCSLSLTTSKSIRHLKSIFLNDPLNKYDKSFYVSTLSSQFKNYNERKYTLPQVANYLNQNRTHSSYSNYGNKYETVTHSYEVTRYHDKDGINKDTFQYNDINAFEKDIQSIYIDAHHRDQNRNSSSTFIQSKNTNEDAPESNGTTLYSDLNFYGDHISSFLSIGRKNENTTQQNLRFPIIGNFKPFGVSNTTENDMKNNPIFNISKSDEEKWIRDNRVISDKVYEPIHRATYGWKHDQEVLRHHLHSLKSNRGTRDESFVRNRNKRAPYQFKPVIEPPQHTPPTSQFNDMEMIYEQGQSTPAVCRSVNSEEVQKLSYKDYFPKKVETYVDQTKKTELGKNAQVFRQIEISDALFAPGADFAALFAAVTVRDIYVTEPATITSITPPPTTTRGVPPKPPEKKQGRVRISRPPKRTTVKTTPYATAEYETEHYETIKQDDFEYYPHGPDTDVVSDDYYIGEGRPTMPRPVTTRLTFQVPEEWMKITLPWLNFRPGMG